MTWVKMTIEFDTDDAWLQFRHGDGPVTAIVSRLVLQAVDPVMRFENTKILGSSCVLKRVEQVPKTRAEQLQENIRRQKEWIERCGGDLVGYITNYGSKDDPNHSGDGGEAIYEADIAYLRVLEARQT